MIPTVGNTLNTVDYEMSILEDQYIRKLKIHGISDGKKLMLMKIVINLINDQNVTDEDKLFLNGVLINFKKNFKIY